MTLDEIAALSQRIATQIRVMVPRSSNRFHDSNDDDGTDWLKDQSKIGYTDFVLSVSRIKAKHGTQDALQKVSKKKVLCFFTKKVSGVATASELRDAVLDFLAHGMVNGKPVDLNYKPNLGAEQEYSKEFAAALAQFMNAKGFRKKNGQPFGDTVMNNIKSELLSNDRGLRLGVTSSKRPPMPLKYIASSARNAIKFGIGNCEECACTAYSMLVGAPSDSVVPISVELVYGSSNGDAHFFVIVNRSGAQNIYDDVANWWNDPTVIACDPWITDRGVGGRITASGAGMAELRDFLNPTHTQKGGLTTLEVRASSYIGSSRDDLQIKGNPKFQLPG